MKKKHKLLLVLSCIPLLMCCLILPLCSFTTVLNTDEFDVYKSYSNNGIRYNYTAGSTGTYKGIIPDVSRVLIVKNPTTFNQASASIKLQACNYYLTSSYRIDIDSDFTGLREVGTNLEAPYDYILDMFYVGVPTPNERVKFPYEVYVENITFDQYLTYSFCSLYQGNPYFLHLEDWDVTASGSLNYCWVYIDGDDNLEYQSETVYFDSIDVSTDETGRYYLNVPSLCRYVAEGSGLVDDPHSLVTEYVSSFSCTLNVYNTVTGTPNIACDGVLVSSGIVNVNSPNYSRYYLGNSVEKLSDIYDVAYNRGVNAGLSKAPTVWGSVSTFLKTTVGAFLETPLFPNFTISTVLSIFVGAVLLIGFLKIFAGG